MIRDYAGLAPADLEEITTTVRDHLGLDDVFAWGRLQNPAISPADVVRQDEFTHDVLVPFPQGRWLVYGTT